MKALLVGGTGPTGPHIISGLLARGYDVTILHRGLHEPEDLPPVEHIHADPHDSESIGNHIAGRSFDLAIVTYGRLKMLGDHLAGRCARFISVGGIPSHVGVLSPEYFRPFGMRIPTRESDGLAVFAKDSDSSMVRFSHKVWRVEQRIMELHEAGAFAATHIRYPRIYGPRQLESTDWSLVKRVLDGRPYVILPDGGLQIDARAAALNAAHCVLLAVDRPNIASGEIYNCIEDEQFTWRQILEMIVDHLGAETQMLSLPSDVAYPARGLTPMSTYYGHCVLDGAKARNELGYRDVIAPRKALLDQVDWLVKYPAPPSERDPFDYDAEDALISTWKRAEIALKEAADFAPPSSQHVYSRAAPTSSES